MVETQERFETLLGEIAGQRRLAIDTEFHRERTYYPKVALIQVGWSSGIALVDPLNVDVSPFRSVLDSEVLIVMHAADQDLEVMDRICGTMPRHLFDTQLAAGFLGMSSPSLSSLHERELGLRLPKSDRLTDWLARPLSASQQTYAASDVAHLLEIHERQVAQLTERGRLAWMEAECAEFLGRESRRRRPEDAWLRVKEVRKLNGRSRDVARAVAAWREARAAEVDIPVRHVLSDLAVVAIAQRAPTTSEDLARIRGVEKRHLGRGAASEILNAVAGADQLPPINESTSPGADRRQDIRAAVTLLSAWLAQLARDVEMDPALIGTRADIEALVRGDEEARMAIGWRQDLVGSAAGDLLAGRATLAFDGRGGLLLEDRQG
ncbi:MAG: HRDC domain-containing protein [Actinomycetota bacterium]|nr:HRDC domain-containing protein [Actinomycetota bacterium]